MQPMLAVNADLKTLTFPLMASFKYDGVRAFVCDSKGLMKSSKPIPNRYIRSMLSRSEFEGFDGELICGAAREQDTFRRTSKAVSTIDLQTNFSYYVFDYFNKANPNADFWDRYKTLTTKVLDLRKEFPFLHLITNTVINDMDELTTFERFGLGVGYEGVIVRKMSSPYFFGRPPAQEAGLLKIKRFADSEATIIGFEELVRKGKNEGANTLGSLLVKDINSGVVFKLGSGLDDETRSYIWGDQSGCLGKIVKYKYFPKGVKNKPRFPTYLGFRHKSDL